MGRKTPKRPPITRVYFTADIGRMAAARAVGGILWAEEHGDQRGILLWEHIDDAAQYQIGLTGRPTVVVEIDRADIDTALLEPALAPEYHCAGGRRSWIYGDAIAFGSVRWHTYREEIAEPARIYNIDIPRGDRPLEQDLPQGMITLTVQ